MNLNNIIYEIAKKANNGELATIPPVNPARIKELRPIWDDMRGVGK